MQKTPYLDKLKLCFDLHILQHLQVIAHKNRLTCAFPLLNKLQESISNVILNTLHQYMNTVIYWTYSSKTTSMIL